MKFYKDAELAADVMNVNDIPFLTTMSSNMHYETIAALNNLKCTSLEFELNNVIRSNAVRRFRISMVIVCVQFRSLKIETC